MLIMVIMLILHYSSDYTSFGFNSRVFLRDIRHFNELSYRALGVCILP